MRNIILGSSALLLSLQCAGVDKKPLNVVLITADDLNYSDVGYMGSQVPNATPNLDRLAAQGMKFQNAYVNIAVSQPSRSVLATGMYPHNNGVEGFFHTTKDIPTVMSVLRGHGYRTGIAGKYGHSTPVASFKWDTEVEQPDLGDGRDPKRYYEVFNEFVKQSKEMDKPFYFMANSHDPHEPFHGSAREKKVYPDKNFPDASYVFKAEEMVVPEFLPDLPETRIELAQYYSSIRRLDDMVGEIIRVIKEQGIEDNTLIMFLSDNGMDFPFAKTNCYLNSNKTPWIVKWPSVVKAGSSDTTHFISGIDFLPTVLEACGIPFDSKIDGHSFVPLLRNQKQPERTRVYTQFYETSAKRSYPMFAIHAADFSYIFSPWADGSTVFQNRAQLGMTFQAMLKIGDSDLEIKKRTDFFKYRTKEELYDVKKDPNGLNNLIDSEQHKDILAGLQADMERWMIETQAWGLELFKNRNDAEFCKRFIEKQTDLVKSRAALMKSKKKKKSIK